MNLPLQTILNKEYTIYILLADRKVNDFYEFF